jgi:hypothetical protein
MGSASKSSIRWPAAPMRSLSQGVFLRRHPSLDSEAALGNFREHADGAAQELDRAQPDGWPSVFVRVTGCSYVLGSLSGSRGGYFSGPTSEGSRIHASDSNGSGSKQRMDEALWCGGRDSIDVVDSVSIAFLAGSRLVLRCLVFRESHWAARTEVATGSAHLIETWSSFARAQVGGS